MATITLRDLPAPGAYVAAWKRANAVVAAGGTVRTSWAGADLDAAAWRRNVRDALDRRINARGGLVQTGRKWEYLYQLELERDARAIQARLTRRVRVYQFGTPEIRKRFGHLLSRYDD
jgi:hypothetical protein